MTRIDWSVVALVIVVTMAAGMAVVRLSSKHGALSYFTSDRDLPWWAVAISNTSTYQSGNGVWVMLMLVYGLSCNWLWWSSWVIWMPLVAIIWAPMWRRMRIMTTAELITLRYGGQQALVARRLYALVCCFGFAVILVAYVSGFFTKTIAPLVDMPEWEIILIFGGTTVIYTMFGGLTGVVVTEALHFVILLGGCTAFMVVAVAQNGGWRHILEKIQSVRPEALAQFPPVNAAAPENSIALLTVVVLAAQGIFYAGSPTAGEGSTAQRFMAARSPRHAMAGQLFNCFLALCLRALPLIGTGLVALAVFWPATLAEHGGVPAGMTLLKDPVTAWGELIKRCHLAPGFRGLLVAVEAAAYTSSLSALLNWGGSFVVNDLWRAFRPTATAREEIWMSRAAILALFAAAVVLSLAAVHHLIGWYMFINSAMVIFLLPLAFFRFFWWRFNVWGELAAILLGLPISTLVWFAWQFDNEAKHPMWQGLALLFGLSFIVLLGVTFLTPPESDETLERFYERCRPPGLWGKFTRPPNLELGEAPLRKLVLDSLLGVVACLALVIATNALFVRDWLRLALSSGACLGLTFWLVARVLNSGAVKPAGAAPSPQPKGVEV